MGKAKLLKMFRIAIIGVGKWGMNYVSTVEKSLYKEVEIVAISRLSKKKKSIFHFTKWQ